KVNGLGSSLTFGSLSAGLGDFLSSATPGPTPAQRRRIPTRTAVRMTSTRGLNRPSTIAVTLRYFPKQPTFTRTWGGMPYAREGRQGHYHRTSAAGLAGHDPFPHLLPGTRPTGRHDSARLRRLGQSGHRRPPRLRAPCGRRLAAAVGPGLPTPDPARVRGEAVGLAAGGRRPAPRLAPQ